MAAAGSRRRTCRGCSTWPSADTPPVRPRWSPTDAVPAADSAWPSCAAWSRRTGARSESPTWTVAAGSWSACPPRPSLLHGGRVDPVERVVAGAVGVNRQRHRDVQQQAPQAFGVLAEDAENLLLGDTVVAVDAGVQVGHQGQRGVAEGELAGEHRFRVTGHVDDRAAQAGVPARLGP